MPDNAENANKFICEKCDFRCSKQSNFVTHISTNKHKKIMGDNQNECQPSSIASFNCPNCNKKYSHLSGLCRHRKTCVVVKQEIKSKEKIVCDSDSDSDSDEIYSDDYTLQTENVIIHKNIKRCEKNTEKKIKNLTAENREIKKMMMTMLTSNTQLQSQMIEMMKKSSQSQMTNPTPVQSTVGVASNLKGDHNTINNSNNTNNTFNMNMFLNEKCKDAMNMTDFVNSIQLNMIDMENVERDGYVEGMSNILITNLQKTDVYKRPVHCSDVKRETIYVKDDNKWERDAPNHPKMVNAVLAVEQKNVAMVGEWAKANPRCMNSSYKENEKYFKLSKAATDGEKDGNIAKVIRKVAKNVSIDKETPLIQ